MLEDEKEEMLEWKGSDGGRKWLRVEGEENKRQEEDKRML